MVRTRRCRYILLMILWLFLAAGEVKADAGPKLLLVVLTRVDLKELGTGNYPYFQRVLTQGQVGLVSIRVAGRLTPEKVYQELRGTHPSLTGASLRTAFLGNADLPWKPNRSAKKMIQEQTIGVLP